MKLPFVVVNLLNRYCQVVFGLALIIGLLVTPRTALAGHYLFLSIPFIILFALTMTCSIRSIKEKVTVARYQHKSLLGIIASVVGLSAIQACGIGTPFCGASLGISVLSALFPSALVHALIEHSVAILAVSIVIQIISLYMMGCFKITRHPIKK